jgi:Holliday junction resolvase RusA-like endonuclease
MKKNFCNIGKPFSANQMYVPLGKGRMAKSSKYRKWIEDNTIHLEGMREAQKFPVIVDVLILANQQWTMKNDPDNCLKPIMDLLVRGGIIPDDSNRFVEKVSARVLYCPGEPMVRISYEEPDEVLETY